MADDGDARGGAVAAIGVAPDDEAIGVSPDDAAIGDATVAVVPAKDDDARDDDDDGMAVVDYGSDGSDAVPFGGAKGTATRNRSVRRRKPAAPEEAADLPPAMQRSEAMGPFWFEAGRNIVVTDADGRRKTQHRGIYGVEKQRLRELLKQGFITPEFLRDTVVPMNDETSSVPRLRAHDYALTNCLKGVPRLKVVPQSDGTVELVDPYIDYQRQLEKDHRLLFDPFRRGTHLFFKVDGKTHYTTAGQLTYIRFGNDYDIHRYVEENEAAISEAMRAAARGKSHAAVKKRRRELTKAPVRMCRGSVHAAFDIVTDRDEELAAAKSRTDAAKPLLTATKPLHLGAAAAALLDEDACPTLEPPPSKRPALGHADSCTPI